MTQDLVWRNIAERELREKLVQWARAESRSLANAIVFLEGEMGAGKSTFARALLEALAPGQLSKGSPTFPLVQEYRADAGYLIYHIDLYRLKSESELEESGLLAQIEERDTLALVEWASLFPGALEYWRAPSAKPRAKSVWSVAITRGDAPERRSFEIRRGGAS